MISDKVSPQNSLESETPLSHKVNIMFGDTDNNELKLSLYAANLYWYDDKLVI